MNYFGHILRDMIRTGVREGDVHPGEKPEAVAWKNISRTVSSRAAVNNLIIAGIIASVC